MNQRNRPLSLVRNPAFAWVLVLGLTVPGGACDDGTSSPAMPGRDMAPVLAASGQVRSDVCHRTEGTNDFVLVSIADPALDDHLAHGDARVGDPVPGQDGMVFDGGCEPIPGSGFCDMSDPNNGAPTGLSFDADGLIDELESLVQSTALDPANIGDSSLDISITSVNGVFHEHGSATIPMMDVSVFVADDPLSLVLVDWSGLDQEPAVTGDRYTVCVIVRCRDCVGAQQCGSFQI